MGFVVKTDFQFKNQKKTYKGKVRDVYFLDNDLMVVVVTDRISAFDVILPIGIPFKGQVLNQITAAFLDATKDILPNWKLASPDPMVTVGYYCHPFKVEMVVRAYLTGHAWRLYKAGKRTICGVNMPDNMKENQKFDKPIITPTTKALVGHDMDISKDEIINTGLVSKNDYEALEKYALALFDRGTAIAQKMGLILVDTKYEFGKRKGDIYLIDEIHTPDSSRYFYANEYLNRMENNLPQKQLSKEFVREWLMDRGFNGLQEKKMPTFDPFFISDVSERYIELYEKITGLPFKRAENDDINERIFKNVTSYLETII